MAKSSNIQLAFKRVRVSISGQGSDENCLPLDHPCKIKLMPCLEFRWSQAMIRWFKPPFLIQIADFPVFKSNHPNSKGFPAMLPLRRTMPSTGTRCYDCPCDRGTFWTVCCHWWRLYEISACTKKPSLDIEMNRDEYHVLVGHVNLRGSCWTCSSLGSVVLPMNLWPIGGVAKTWCQGYKMGNNSTWLLFVGIGVVNAEILLLGMKPRRWCQLVLFCWLWYFNHQCRAIFRPRRQGRQEASLEGGNIFHPVRNPEINLKSTKIYYQIYYRETIWLHHDKLH